MDSMRPSFPSSLSDSKTKLERNMASLRKAFSAGVLGSVLGNSYSSKLRVGAKMLSCRARDCDDRQERIVELR